MATTPQPSLTTDTYSTTDLWERASPAGTAVGLGTAGVLSAGISRVVKIASSGNPTETGPSSGYGYETSQPSTVPPLREYHTQQSIREISYNGTGYYLEDEGETGLNDIQTLFLACFATLIFLAVIVFAALGIRMLWRNFQRSKETTNYDGILQREGTSESVSRPLHSHLLEGDKNLAGAHLILTTEEVQVCDGIEINSQIRSNNHSNTNGSIITMTMKNNHLIVETEERNDLEEDSRETTMKYSPGARDGVFVVEVQQGGRSPGSGGHTSCTEPVSISVSDQCALVHNPPDRYSDEETLGEYDDSEYYVDTVSPSRDTPDSLLSRMKTGLAQSNASLSQPSYCYSNQQCYDMGSYGYSYGYTEQNRLYANARKVSEDTRPKITAAIYKSTLKRSPSTEDLHLAAMSNSEDDTVNDVSKASSNGEVHSENRTSTVDVKKDTLETSSSDRSKEEQETRSADYENGGFECNDLSKS